MKNFLPVLVFLAGLGSSISFAQVRPSVGPRLPGALSGQTACLNSDGRRCPPDLEMRRCADEKVTPNLSISKPVKLNGTLLDETGAPIIFERTLVQIRDQKTDAVLLSAPPDEKGKFDLGRVPAGEFRFIAVQLRAGKTVRLPLADQPKALICSDDAECRLKIVIHFHGTDNPIDFCPPK